MSKKTPSPTNGLSAIIIASAQEVSQTTEKAIEYLNEEGVPVTFMLAKGLKEIKKIQLEVNAEETRKRMLNLSKYQQKAIDIVEKLLQSPNFTFLNFVTEKKLSLHNRNIEAFSQEDVKNTLINYYILSLSSEDTEP